MHRSGSASRFAKDFFTQTLSSSPSPPSHVPGNRPSSDPADRERLPMYDPLSPAAKKESSDVRFAEHAVHLIPLVLILCAITLWLFSNPELKV